MTGLTIDLKSNFTTSEQGLPRDYRWAEGSGGDDGGSRPHCCDGFMSVFMCQNVSNWTH